MDEKIDSGTAKGRVLIVDDEARNRELLRDLLESQGYEVTEAENGAAALAVVAQAAPHAILMDVMMPGLDGFEVCRQLKANPATAPIPILMITALHERDDRLKGIAAGASDFLTKPIDTRDVMLRTRNAVNSKQLYDLVQTGLEKLKHLEQLRDNLTNMIVHDMRAPLTGILGNLGLMEMHLGQRLEAGDRTCLTEALSATRILIEMVNALLDVSKFEAGAMVLKREICDLKQVVADEVQCLGGLFKQSSVIIKEPNGNSKVFCDRKLVQRIVANLLSNAAKYSPSGGLIEVVLQQVADTVKIMVIDQGPGVSPEYHARIFEKYGQVDSGMERKQYSTGLGLIFCKLTVEAHGGHIGVDSVPGHGSTFWFTLPIS